jgi:hypothetical protein
MSRIRNVSLASAVFALLGAGAAQAAGPSVAGYGGKAGGVEGQVATASHPAGTLPFTGLNLTLALLAGIVLVAVGLYLRRTRDAQL